MKELNTGKTTCFLIFVCLIIGLVFSSSSFAADFPHRIDSEKRSEKEGLGRDTVSLIKRMPGPGRETVAEKIMARSKDSKTPITTQGTAKKQTKGKRLSVIGEGWFLDVNGDGTSVRYRNYKFLDSQPELARPVSARLSDQKLEELGLKFIKENLSEFIKLAEEEEIVPFYTEHAIGIAGQAKEGATSYEEKIYASIVIFTRTVNKINVIGSGSKIAIMFNNEGVPVGFDYDWPQYKSTGKSQKVLPLEAIKSRAKKLASLNIDSPDVRVKRFDCGLYDAGVRKHDPQSVIQAGCAIQYYEKKIIDEDAYKRDKNSGHSVAAYIDFIPAGETVAEDGKWPQAMKILNKKPGKGFAAPKEGPKRGKRI